MVTPIRLNHLMRTYIGSMIVNLQGIEDPRGCDYPSWDEVLREYYEELEDIPFGTNEEVPDWFESDRNEGENDDE